MGERIQIERNLAGLEDLLFGFGIINQTRDGEVVPVTKINAGNLPFSETENLAEKMAVVDEVLALFTTYADEFQFIQDNSAAILAIPGQLSDMQDIEANITLMYDAFLAGSIAVKCDPILLADFIIPDNTSLAVHGDIDLNGFDIIFGVNSHLCMY